MKLVDSSIRYPVTVTVVVLLVSIFGLLALFRIPVQLVPSSENARVQVVTAWPGASPEEIETEIVQKQEEQLKTLEGLTEMTSQSRESSATIVLDFQTGTNLDNALIRVGNKLEQVLEYPPTALKPVITTGSVIAETAAWIILAAVEGADVEIETERDFTEDVIRPALERVPGVSTTTVFGGSERELRVTVDPQKLATRGLTLDRVAASLDSENRDISAGDFDEGKRSLVVRTVAEYRSPEDVESVVLAWSDGAPVYVRDVATVELGYKERNTVSRLAGVPTIGISLARQSGTNTIEVLTAVREAVAELNETLLRPRGIRMEVVYAQSDYIESAITLVQRNIFLGGALAVAVLLLFLRSISSTLIIGLAIPVSVVGTFLVMTALGRNINVVSLAGLAFAVGMIVDASIVVLENIYRHMQLGKRRRQAAYDGAVEVWGAVLASVLTTVAVFVPILFVEEEAGQLFRDIAVAVSSAVLISLVVSITLIPTMSARILHAVPAGSAAGVTGWRRLGGLTELGGRVVDGIADLVYALTRSRAVKVLVIISLTGAAILVAWALVPETEYLPSGNQNFAFGILLPPPGYNQDELTRMSEIVEAEIAPYWEAEPGSPEAAALGAPPIQFFFFMSFSGGGEFSGAFMGLSGYEEYGDRTGELVPVLQGALSKIPGTFGIVQQPSVFQQDAEAGRAVDIDLTGPDLERLFEIGGRVFGTVLATIPGAQAQPIPGLDLGNPEIHVVPDRERAAEVGFTAAQLGFALNALVDGVKVSEYQFEGRAIDLVLRGADRYASRSQDIEFLTVAAPGGRVVSLGDVGRVIATTGAEQINHIERERAVTIQVVPSVQMPIETAMRLIEEQVLEPLRQDGTIGGLYQARLAGTADRLTTTRQALQSNFLLALVVTYLLMAALFESFVYPLVILFSVPFAAVGGFIGMAAVNAFITYQALDIVAMLGFVILIGIVVNNAILIVHQTLVYIRSRDMGHDEALRQAVADRVRPIFMSSVTSVMGMAPLVLAQGAGSEIYRGLGGVVVGGLVFSTVFTLFLVPAVFSLAMDLRAALVRSVPGRRAPAQT